jgi:hypothetical protein
VGFYIAVLLIGGPHIWAGSFPLTTAADLALAAGLIVLRSRLRAATMATAGLLVLGLCGFLLAMYWPSSSCALVSCSPARQAPSATC